MLKILHLSDLHFEKTKYNQEVVVRSFFKDLRLQIEEHPIDVIVFSGDLVDKGFEISFEDVRNNFTQKILEICHLDGSRLFMVPGNHDLDKKVVDDNPYIEVGLSTELSSLDKVNSFIDRLVKGDAVTLPAFDRLKNYTVFEKSIRGKTAILDLPTVQTYQFDVNGLSVGCACFNTAWRCTGAPKDADKGKLLVGERSIDLARDSISSSDISLAIFHHPLEYLAPFEASAVESRLAVGFDLLFYGHVHASLPTIRQSPMGGAFYSQSGCLYTSRDYHNGYQIIKIDEIAREGVVFGRSYFDSPREFRAAVDVLNEKGEHKFNLAQRAENFEDVNRFLSTLRPFIRQRANRHVTIAPENDQPFDEINKVFVCPPMRFGKTAKDIIKRELGTQSDCTIESIISSPSNYIVYGSRESGKTSLAHYISVRFAEGFGDRSRFPTIIDARALRPGDYEFRKAATAYYANGPASISRIEEAIPKFDIVVLLDSFDEREPSHCEALTWLINRPNTRVICFSRETPALMDSKKSIIVRGLRDVHIDNLPRKAIRQLSASRSPNSENGSEIFDNVMKSLVSAHLPWNGYIVSLLLWAYQQNKVFERLNEAVLIENIISFLLEKGSFSSAFRRSFDPRSKEITLQALAVHFSDKNDSMLEEDLYGFVFSFFKKKGLDFSAPAVIERLVDVGLLANDDGIVSFRFRCFQEYFYACAMNENPLLLQHASDLEHISKYAREIDLLTALTRKSSGFIDTTLDWVIKARPDSTGSKKPTSLASAQLSGSGRVGLSPLRRRAMRKDPLSDEQVDQVFEKAERLTLADREERRKRLRNGETKSEPTSPLSWELFLAVETLGKVIRNAEFDDIDMKMPALEIYVELNEEILMKLMGIFDEFADVIETHREEFPGKLNLEDVKSIFNMLKVSFPSAISNLMTEQAGSEKLIPTIVKVLEKSGDSFGTQFLLTSLLLDLDDKGSIQKMVALANAYTGLFHRSLIHEKLSSNYIMRRFKETSRSDLENAIAEVSIMLGGNRNLKGNLIKQLRQQSNKDDV